MTTVDIILLSILGYGLLAGFLRGLVKEVISVGIVLVSFASALLFYPMIASRVNGVFAYPDAAALFSFLVAFAAPVLVAGLVIFIICRFAGTKPLPASHRLMGSLFGLLRGSAVAVVVIIALLAFPLRGHPLDKSRLFPAVRHAVGTARQLFPTRVAEGIEKELARMDKPAEAGAKEAPDGGRKPKQ